MFLRLGVSRTRSGGASCAKVIDVWVTRSRYYVPVVMLVADIEHQHSSN